MDSKTIVLITGSNTGIGYHIAESLAASPVDYHIIICARTPSKGEKALSTLQSIYPNTSFSLLHLDVTDLSTITAAFPTIEKDFGRLDVLISNAGILSHAPDLLTQLRETFETNTFGAATVTEILTPLLLNSINPRLIYITTELGSVSGKADPESPWQFVHAPAYRSSKAALNMLALCTFEELEKAGRGAKVWCFCPGYVVTGFTGTGEEGIAERVKNGAGDPRDSAEGVRKIVEGGRDKDVGKFINQTGRLEW